MPALLSVDDRGPVRRLTIERPETKNAIPADGWAELTAAFRDFAASSQRVLVLSGRDGEFCSGADLSGTDLDGLDSAAAAREWMRGPGEAAMALHRLGKPTIAAVDGVAVGAGMNLAIGCDLVIATERARFAEIFVRRGLTLDFGGTWLLPRLVGLARARELALTGRLVSADEAERIGLVTSVVPVDALDTAVEATVDLLLAGAPMAQRFLKTALDRSSSMNYEQAVDFETQTQAVLLGSADFREALAAFSEKRPPDFSGR
jgi:2-(1,2-epoxy-1,2-dihydrophenyl)acetyl-CoA isomerase